LITDITKTDKQHKYLLALHISYSRYYKSTGIKAMTTHFITAEIDLQETPTELQKVVEAELQKQGKPLRWAITSVDVAQQKATVEAVVTRASAE
jgi:hypothetical protein